MKKAAFRNLRLCTKDCLCLYVCPTGATDTEDSIIDVSKCIGCGDCAAACPSGAISMLSTELPPQQKKAESVISYARKLTKNKADEEQIASAISEMVINDGMYRLMTALAKSARLVNEDIMRESGYMLPQSKNTKDLLEGWVNDPPAAGFPVDAAKELLKLIKFNE